MCKIRWSSVIVQSCISASGVAEVVKIDGSMNSWILIHYAATSGKHLSSKPDENETIKTWLFCSPSSRLQHLSGPLQNQKMQPA